MAATQDIFYEPINTESKEIRLLRLSARYSPGLPALCEIFHSSLDDNPQYEALSYSWGDAELRDAIIVNDHPASVTVNLARALEDIRFDGRTRILWVDALCIDQKNIKERNHQVKHMGSIYQKAERVVVWVGRPTKKDRKSQESILNSWDDMIKIGLQYSTYQPARRAKWLSMASFCELPYWRRLWIVQEIGLASELWVYHGRSCQNWKEFSRVRKAVQKLKSSTELHASLRGIATAISEGLPGRLDQQRDYQQPLLLRQMHDAIQHLLSRAENAANATWMLSEVFQTLGMENQLFEPVAAQRTIAGADSQVSTSSPSESIEIIYGRVTDIAAQFATSWTEGNLGLLPDEGFESPLNLDRKTQVSIHPFLPLDPNLAKAFELLPRHIRHVRDYERQEYEQELKERRDAIYKILRTSRDFSISRTEFNYSKAPPYSSWDKDGNQKPLIQLPPHLSLEDKRLLRQIEQMRRAAQPSREQSVEDSEKTQERVLQLETRSEKIEKLKRKIKYVNDRDREVKHYFAAWGRLHDSLRSFSRDLATEMNNHQPAFLLRTLLETCERSLCQNPRDKVYGLLGLASNIKNSELLVDYSKSMLSLFWDVVRLTNEQENSQTMDTEIRDSFQTELVRFAQLLQRSLGGPFPADELIDAQKVTEIGLQQVLQLPGFIIGPILLLDFGDGLSASALYQSRMEILKHYFEVQRSQGSLTAMVTTVLDQLEEARQDLLAAMSGIHAWGSQNVPRHEDSPRQNIHCRKIKRLRNSRPILFVESSGLIGIAPSTARSDDILVQFSNCDVAAILRPSVEAEDGYRVIGRAVVARRFDEKRKTVSDSSPELFKYAVPDPQSLVADKLVWFELDAVTLQELTCPVSEKREYKFDMLAV